MYENELYHHGIKGQKWGVRRFQNTDGSLTSDGKKRYGEGSDRVEKYSKKAVGWENRAINAKTGIGRGISTEMAMYRRAKSDRLAEKATNDYKFLAVNKNAARTLRSQSETKANIAKGLKERSENSTGLKQKYLMEKAIKNLASANNYDIAGMRYSDVANAKIGKKMSTYINDVVRESSYTNAGRKRSFGTSVAESIGDQVISNVFNNKTSSSIDQRINNIDSNAGKLAAATGKRVASNFVAGGAVTKGRDLHYRVKNSQNKRWNDMAR